MPSSKRCILNVATGRYVPYQARLMKSLAGAGWKDTLMTWTDTFPRGSPSHREVPYAFKVHSIRAALQRGHTSILWLDSICVAEKPVESVFERIEREGYLLVTGKDRLGNWSNDSCLASFGLSRDDAMALQLINGSFIGLDLSQGLARTWFDELAAACERGLFEGHYLSDHAPAEVRAAKPGKPVGFVSTDPRCWGHRHDEAVGSCLAHRHGMKVMSQGEFFDVGDSPTAIIRSRKD
jgi:hypothetical protein